MLAEVHQDIFERNALYIRAHTGSLRRKFPAFTLGNAA